MGGLKQEVVSTKELYSDSLWSEAGRGHMVAHYSYHLPERILDHLEDKLLVMSVRDI